MTVPKYQQLFKNFNIMEFYDHIWNHHEKYIQQSTNMPGFGSVVCEIDVKMSKMWDSKKIFAQ